MSREKLVRAWKDPEYRQSLSEAERAQLEENPAGMMQLTDEDLRPAQGGGTPTVTVHFTIMVSYHRCPFKTRTCW